MNLPNWRTDSVAQAVFDPRELDDLERELNALAERSSDAAVVHYGLGSSCSSVVSSCRVQSPANPDIC